MQSANPAHGPLHTVPAIVWDTFSSSPLPQVILERESLRILDVNPSAAEVLTLLATASPRDDLTGLSTRESLTPALNAALRRMDDRAAVAFLDLDNFKEVNDTEGHLMGDEILRSAAHAIRSVVRSVDTVIRFGGDEFVVVLPGIADVKDAMYLTSRINRAIATATADTGYGITASIGVAIVATGDSGHFDALHSADQAMYEAKAAGGNQTRIAILV